MKKFYLASISLLTSFALVACSNGGGGSGKKSGPQNPQTPDEALQKLSAEHKAQFENWKLQIVKACDAAQAFGLNQRNSIDQNGIDAAALILKNNKSVVFTDGDNFVLLNGYRSFAGEGTSQSEENTTINGQNYSIKAETKRQGSNCSLYLYGQKIYETYIAESFSVGSQFIKGSTPTTLNLALPQIKTLGSSGAAEAASIRIANLISQSLKASKESLNIVAQKLQIKDTEAAQFFKLTNNSSGNLAYRLAQEKTALWSSDENDNLIAQESILKTLFDGNTHKMSLEIRLSLPQFQFDQVKNEKDLGNLKLIYEVEITKQNNSFVYATQSIDLSQFIAFDTSESAQCVQSRVDAYVGHSLSANSIQPSAQALFSPCKILHNDIQNLSMKNGLLKSLMPKIFSRAHPSPQFQYNGWDRILSDLALDVLKQNKNIEAELDPTQSTPLIQIIDDHLHSLQKELAHTKNMALVEDSVYNMGLSWSFNGQIVAVSRMSQIVNALDNAVDTFKVSAERLLNALGSQPNSSSDELNFALNINAAYKSEAVKSLNLAKELNYLAFENDVFNQVIQRRTPLIEFQDWSQKLTAVKTEINQFPNITNVKSELVGLSIKWLKSGELSSQDLPGVYRAIDNVANPFTESTQELLQNLSQSSLAAHQATLDFARALTPEYKQLALAIKANSMACDYESWGNSFFKSILQKKPSLEQLRQWNDMWAGTRAFIQREISRVASDFGSSPEWNRKEVIETAINESWTNQDFVAMEEIASVARAKNTCGHYKDASSQANCAGMSLFSKGDKKFLSPTYNHRYTVLARSFNNYMNLLSANEWTSLRWSLIGEFFGSWEPIWSSCNQNSFNSKSSALDSQVKSMVQETNQLKKWELERQIKETIKNCQ